MGFAITIIECMLCLAEWIRLLVEQYCQRNPSRPSLSSSSSSSSSSLPSWSLCQSWPSAGLALSGSSFGGFLNAWLRSAWNVINRQTGHAAKKMDFFDWYCFRNSLLEIVLIFRDSHGAPKLLLEKVVIFRNSLGLRLQNKTDDLLHNPHTSH